MNNGTLEPAAWLQTLPLSLTSCITLDKILTFLGLIHKMRKILPIPFGGLPELIHVNVFLAVFGTWKVLIKY